MTLSVRHSATLVALAACLVVPVSAVEDNKADDWPVGADGRPVVFGEFDSLMNGSREVVAPAVTDVENVFHVSGSRCEARSEQIDELVASVSGQVSAAKVNSRLVLDLAEARVEALEPTTWVFRSEAVHVRKALENELARIRAIRTVEMDAEVAATLDAAAAAIAAAAENMKEAPGQ